MNSGLIASSCSKVKFVGDETRIKSRPVRVDSRSAIPWFQGRLLASTQRLLFCLSGIIRFFKRCFSQIVHLIALRYDGKPESYCYFRQY